MCIVFKLFTFLITVFEGSNSTDDTLKTVHDRHRYRGIIPNSVLFWDCFFSPECKTYHSCSTLSHKGPSVTRHQLCLCVKESENGCERNAESICVKESKSE